MFSRYARFYGLELGLAIDGPSSPQGVPKTVAVALRV